MKSLKEMFTRQKVLRKWQWVTECPTEMVDCVVKELRESDFQPKVVRGCNEKGKVISVDFVLERAETDEEVIERATKEHEENMKTLEELLAAYYEVPNFYSIISARARFDSAVDKFKRGESI